MQALVRLPGLLPEIQDPQKAQPKTVPQREKRSRTHRSMMMQDMVPKRVLMSLLRKALMLLRISLPESLSHGRKSYWPS